MFHILELHMSLADICADVQLKMVMEDIKKQFSLVTVPPGLRI